MSQPVPAVAATVGEWHVYEGCAFGSVVPVMRGAIAVKAPPKVFFSIIDQAFKERFKGELTKRIKAASRPSEGLLHRVLQWSLMIQRLKKIPVSLEYRVLAAVRPDAPTPIAVPYVHPRATAVVISILCRALPTLLKVEKSAKQVADIMLHLDDEVSEAIGRYAEPGQNRAYFVQIARDKGVPINTVNRYHPVFGSGKHAIRLESTLTGQEPGVAIKIANNKQLTGLLLRQAGLPGADNRPIGSIDQARAAVEQLGYPVVIKPNDKDRGEGVFADIRSDDALEWAYGKAAKISTRLLLEKHFEGWGHRIALFGDVLLSATRKTPAGVKGDGQTNIRELIELKRIKREKERSATDAYHQPLQLDEEAMGILNDLKMTPENVLPEGEFVALRRKNNTFAGGETDNLEAADIHPDNMQLCKDAAAVIGLELAGVDLLIPNISVSWETSGALICELNAKPQVSYLAAENLIDVLFPDGGRVPVHVVLASDPDRIALQDLLALGDRLGCDVVADRRTLFVNGQRKPRSFGSSFEAMRAAIFDSKGASLLCVLSVADALKSGLPIGHIDSIFAVTDGTPINQQTDQMKGALSILKPNCSKIISLPRSLKTEG